MTQSQWFAIRWEIVIVAFSAKDMATAQALVAALKALDAVIQPMLQPG